MQYLDVKRTIKLKTSVSLRSVMVAPCGIYCGACSGHLRSKNKCPGCRQNDDGKPNYCLTCIIANCNTLLQSKSGFCYECEKFPCLRLKQLNKRYVTKYNTNLLQNLEHIKTKGIRAYLKIEKEKRTCKVCGSLTCIHKNTCPSCNTELNK